MDQPILGRLFTNIVDIYDKMDINEFIEVMDAKYSPVEFSGDMKFDFRSSQKIRGWYITQGDTVLRAEHFKFKNANTNLDIPEEGGSISVKGLYLTKG